MYIHPQPSRQWKLSDATERYLDDPELEFLFYALRYVGVSAMVSRIWDGSQ